MDDKARERVEIAKDILAQLAAEKLRADTQLYVEFDSGYYPDPEAPAQPIIDQITENCTVCARGALILSYVRRHNKLKVGELNRNALMDYNSVLTQFFNIAQIKLIEDVFETRYGWQAYREVYPDDNERLAFIMQNVVDNQGTFRPDEQYYDDAYSESGYGEDPYDVEEEEEEDEPIGD